MADSKNPLEIPLLELLKISLADTTSRHRSRVLPLIIANKTTFAHAINTLRTPVKVVYDVWMKQFEKPLCTYDTFRRNLESAGIYSAKTNSHDLDVPVPSAQETFSALDLKQEDDKPQIDGEKQPTALPYQPSLPAGISAEFFKRHSTPEEEKPIKNPPSRHPALSLAPQKIEGLDTSAPMSNEMAQLKRTKT